jgi:hypothetical protein
MRTDFIKEENIENNLASLDNLLSGSNIKVEDYLKIALLVKILEKLEEINDKIR